MLDSVRAVLQGFPHVANQVVLVGQSQGGGATFAAAGIAPAYAAELNIRAGVATGVPLLGPPAPQPAAASSGAPPDQAAANRKASDREVSDRPDPTIAYALYIGIFMQQIDPGRTPEQLVTDRAAGLFQAARTTCVGALVHDVVHAGLNRQNALQPGFATAFATVLPELTYSTFHLPRPLFVGTGQADHDVPPSRQLALVRQSCAAGSLIEAHLYKGLDHGETVNASLKDSLPFVRRVMAGEPVPPICTPAPQ